MAENHLHLKKSIVHLNFQISRNGSAEITTLGLSL